MIARLKSVRYFGSSPTGTNRHSVTERFSQSNDVRTNSRLLKSKPLTRAPKTSLHFIDDEQYFSFVAQSSYRFEVSTGRHDDSPLTLNRLNKHCGDFLVENGGKGINVSVLNVTKTAWQRLEGFVLGWLPGGR